MSNSDRRFEILFQCVDQAKTELYFQQGLDNEVSDAASFDAIAEMRQFVETLKEQPAPLYTTV